MLSRDSEDEMWSRFVFELVIWPQEVTLARWTRPSGPLCFRQCLYLITFANLVTNAMKLSRLEPKDYWRTSYRAGLSESYQILCLFCRTPTCNCWWIMILIITIQLSMTSVRVSWAGLLEKSTSVCADFVKVMPQLFCHDLDSIMLNLRGDTYLFLFLILNSQVVWISR